jgi:hypothetical protein
VRRFVFSLRHIFSLSGLLLAPALLSSGCYSAGDGVAPPDDRIYFPVGLALVNDSRHLLVANSDFDLQFNAGTLNVLSVENLVPLVMRPCASNADCADFEGRPECDTSIGLCSDQPSGGNPCGTLSDLPLEKQVLTPGRCSYIDTAKPSSAGDVLVSKVQIGAFATDVVFRQKPGFLPEEHGPEEVAGRAFVPVRGDATLHWVDVTGAGKLQCGQSQDGGACDDLHRAGNHTEENSRKLRLNHEPYAVDASPGGEAVLVTNQNTGTVSLFVNDWNPSVGLSLQFALTGLPLRPVGVAALPTPAYAASHDDAYPPGFLVTYRDAAVVDLIRYYDDENGNRGGGQFARPYAARTNSIGININSVGTDSRGIAVDATARRSAERACPAGDSECLVAASATPLDVFVANRSPATLLVGRTAPFRNALESTEVPNFYDSIALTLGPSRVVVGNVVVGTEATGEPVLERRVFVVCFDSHRIFIYDPRSRRFESEIMTGRGPHALAVDEKRGWLFIGHFTDSYISVVSLDRRFTKTYGKTLATIGEPTPPRASK